MANGEVWAEFQHDPRSSSSGGLRASDADRDIVLAALGDAYADGRIDRDELDQRTDSANAARTLGELVPLLADLVPLAASDSRVRPSPDVHAQAVAKWEKSRREALMSFLTPVLICWAIWAATMFGGFPWPVFVMIPTGLGLVSTLVRRQDMIESNERRILEKQAEKLENKPKPPELEG